MKISILQPCFLPWLGYFNIIKKSDKVIFLDDVQFDKRSWQQRNQIKTNNGSVFLTIPVFSKNKFYQKIKDVKIDYSNDFIKKHSKSIYHNYSRAKYFDLYFKDLQIIYKKKYLYLDQLNKMFIFMFLEKVFKIKRNFYNSSDLNLKSKKTDLIVDICKNYNASVYISAPGGKAYLDENLFKQNKIELIYNEFNHPIYNQISGDFLPNMSVIDLIMNEGPNSCNFI